jgi:transcriptional regulator with XRE-family HTH domain
MASAPNVLRQDTQSSEPVTMPRSLFGSPTRAAYRAAVAQIIRDAKARNGLSNERLAERLRCSESTIFNAENENGNLDAVTLLTIAFEFGEETIAPVRNLYLCAPPSDETMTEKRRRLIRELAALEDDR